jgi:uncharacterized damage-inducible protein DinB
VKRMTCACALLFVIAACGVSHAQSANPLQAGATKTYGIIKNYVTKAAEKMPAENYGFKATPDVRSFAELVAHIADANFGFCATVAGENPPKGGFDPANSLSKSLTAKGDLQKALAESYAYCDKVYAAVTDAEAAKIVKTPFAGELPKRSFLDFNTAHNFEHYGNMVTYMRIKGIVPPSSERAPSSASKE